MTGLLDAHSRHCPKRRSSFHTLVMLSNVTLWMQSRVTIVICATETSFGQGRIVGTTWEGDMWDDRRPPLGGFGRGQTTT